GEWSKTIRSWTLPGIPESIQVTSTSTSNTLTWNPVRGATGYDIEIQGNSVNVGSSPTFTDTDVNSNTQRTYRVRAKNSSGAGKWTDIIAKTTLPDIPQNLYGIPKDTQIILMWDSVAGAREYELEIDDQTII
ncbi:hypothetical protein RCF13_00300, partial [Stenotrophomonas maltophilia group sp. RNC7]|nr:hypothetical protein [Stenotrophomonas maltophilia group sp. RNC7]